MRWHVAVNNVGDSRLRVRTGPGLSYRVVDYVYENSTGIVIDSKTVSGRTWYKWEDTGYWSCGIQNDGTKYITMLYDLGGSPQQPSTPKAPETPIIDPGDLYVDYGGMKDLGTSGEAGISTWYQPSYKGSATFKEIDYKEYDNEFIVKEIAKIKYNMDIGYKNKDDIYSDYTKDNISKGYVSDLQKKLYNSFNRNKVAYPDKELSKTFAYVFFTRPDLNILTRASGSKDFSLTKQMSYDLKYEYLYKNNPWCLKSLIDAGNPNHKFMIFLSNEALSFEVGDIVLKTHEHGETYNGHKIMYGRSDIESNIAGEMSVRYIDTVNLDVFKLHLAWVDYINKVSRGIFCPKRDYIRGKILDYACSCYYILCGPDGSTILYWQKLTGVFPVNTGENVFSWDSGTLLAKPEINIKYMYSFKSSMDPLILHEFNELTSASRKYKYSYDVDNLFGGSTLTHAPYIKLDDTDVVGNQIYRLMWVEN